MKLLGFKKWYEGKSENQSIIVTNNGLNKIGENLFKLPSKMLHIEMDVLTENVISGNSKNKIDRYLIGTNPELLSPAEIKYLKKVLSEGKKLGNQFFLLSYDFSFGDGRKCFKLSSKVVENFKASVDFLSDIPVRPLGKMEKINESYLSKIPSELAKQRIELIECYFDPKETESEIQIPFYFNPNDFNLLEKYKGCLRGILLQSILKDNFSSMVISASKPWPSSRKEKLNESIKPEEDLNSIFEMKYPDPKKSSLLYPQNKPSFTKNKITIKDLTDKRSVSVISYLKEISGGMLIDFIPEGIGYREGTPVLRIAVK